MRPVPLNVFQKTQRLWDTLHPYNAAQAAVLSDSFSRTAIEEAFQLAIRDLQLGTFVCAAGRYWIDTADARPVPVADVPDLDAYLSAQMNEPFDPLVSMPLRPFVATRNGEQTLGVIYQHWVADSVSIRMVLRGWLSRLLNRPALRPRPAMLDRAGLVSRFGPAVAGWSVVSQAAELLSFTRTMKTMRRLEQPPTDRRVRVSTQTLEPGLSSALRGRARSAGLTVGDVFLAAAAEACSAFGPNVANERRPGLAMGTIVDLRSRARHVPANLFSLLLGFMISPFGADDLTDFDHLLRRARQLRITQVHKRSAEASQLRMMVGLQVVRRMKPAAMLDFYRKRFPLSGGISNVNLAADWSGALHPAPLLRYHRISPTGPLMPLVLTPTTLGDQLSLCCTVRAAVISPDREAQLLAAFTDRLCRFASK